jgi:hypothetical protein
MEVIYVLAGLVVASGLWYVYDDYKTRKAEELLEPFLSIYEEYFYLAQQWPTIGIPQYLSMSEVELDEVRELLFKINFKLNALMDMRSEDVQAALEQTNRPCWPEFPHQGLIRRFEELEALGEPTLHILKLMQEDPDRFVLSEEDKTVCDLGLPEDPQKIILSWRSCWSGHYVGNVEHREECREESICWATDLEVTYLLGWLHSQQESKKLKDLETACKDERQELMTLYGLDK